MSATDSPVSRRTFMKILGGSLALAGLGGLEGCTFFPPEEIIPYVDQPECIVPGKPLFYASSYVHGGFAYGTLVETHLARPTKIEGNPGHPASLGSTDAFMQAYLLELYNPDRGRAVAYRGLPSSWDRFAHWLATEIPGWSASHGRGLRILTETLTSPTLINELDEVVQRFPEARWDSYEVTNRDRVYDGARTAFGRPLNPVYQVDRAEVIVSFDNDFFSEEPGHVRYARDFADRRRVRSGRTAMNRLYSCETMTSLAGAIADHALAASPSRVVMAALALAEKIGLAEAGSGYFARLLEREKNWVAAAAQDLARTRGKGLVLAGLRQPAELHALTHLLNHRLGNIGETVFFTQAPEAKAGGQRGSMDQLVREMFEGKVDTLLILGSNPVYATPGDWAFSEALSRVSHRVAFADRPNETSDVCDWYLPQSHLLETWGDARAYNGALSPIQPMIRPLFPTRSALEVVAMLSGQPGATDHELLKDFWRKNAGTGFEDFWKASLHDGWAKGTEFREESPSLDADRVQVALIRLQGFLEADGSTIELNIQPDPRIGDGRYADNAWLQELPKPLTQLTWENAALVSPKEAQKLEIQTGNRVQIEVRVGDSEKKLLVPVIVQPGHADGAVTLTLGYGRTHSGSVGSGHGFNVYPILSSTDPWMVHRARIAKADGTSELALRQIYFREGASHVIRYGDHRQLLQNPGVIVPPQKKETQPTLLPQDHYGSNAWAMVIDLNVCIGCKICTIACQAENNIPVVGKDQVRLGREMHWIRVDRYFEGPLENPRVLFQPVPCMQCEKAPCEIVCPTEATLHTPDGLNAMIYNRCVGTRYCSNNCPYKVRRFNFLEYSQMHDELIQLRYNPDVTVRSRGVMEKCTYCVQRISAAKIRAADEERPIREGEVVPACAQACPTRAISFGDKSRSDSEVSRLRAEPLNYFLLEDLATLPRTSYLAKLTNQKPDYGSPDTDGSE